MNTVDILMNEKKECIFFYNYVLYRENSSEKKTAACLYGGMAEAVEEIQHITFLPPPAGHVARLLACASLFFSLVKKCRRHLRKKCNTSAVVLT